MDPETPTVANRIDTDAVIAAAGILARGGVVVYPTETLYALGADAFNARGVERVVHLKLRQAGKAIAVLISDVQMLAEIVSDIPPAAQILMSRFWPGPLTLILPARRSVAETLTGGSGSIGVRISSHPMATALVRAVGHPVTAPSANPATRAPAVCIEEARGYFGTSVGAYVDAGRLPGEPASTVIDVCGTPHIVRAGAISAADVFATLGAH